MNGRQTILVVERHSLAEVYNSWSPTRIAELAETAINPGKFVRDSALCAAVNLLAAGETPKAIRAHVESILSIAVSRLTCAGHA